MTESCSDVCKLVGEKLAQLGFDISLTTRIASHQAIIDILAEERALVVRNETRVIPNTNEIQAFLHCGLCLEERPPDQSPRDYAQMEVGMTPWGFQVWCKRHEVNVLHVDYQGYQHPANTTRKEDELW
jgi:hypothetical protein